MAKKSKRNQEHGQEERIKLDYNKLKQMFQWISTIGPAKDRNPEATCTMRITFNRTASRIKNFDEEQSSFDDYIRKFYENRNKRVATQWRKECAIVTVYWYLNIQAKWGGIYARKSVLCICSSSIYFILIMFDNRSKYLYSYYWQF